MWSVSSVKASECKPKKGCAAFSFCSSSNSDVNVIVVWLSWNLGFTATTGSWCAKLRKVFSRRIHSVKAMPFDPEGQPVWPLCIDFFLGPPVPLSYSSFFGACHTRSFFSLLGPEWRSRWSCFVPRTESSRTRYTNGIKRLLRSELWNLVTRSANCKGTTDGKVDHISCCSILISFEVEICIQQVH